MSISLYDITVPSYLQIIDSTIKIMQKAEDYAQAKGMPLDDINELRVHEDMFPLSFQIRSVVHHSLNALKGMQSGEFGPPGKEQYDFAGLKKLLEDARAEVDAFQKSDVDALAGGQIVFKLGSMEIPFSCENFVYSFSLPNFYFHATTAYDILRAAGVPLGKTDYLGQMRMGT